MHCTGVNSCKGTSECKSAKNSCKGMNSCKGQGWMSMSKADCDAAKAKAKAAAKLSRSAEAGVGAPVDGPHGPGTLLTMKIRRLRSGPAHARTMRPCSSEPHAIDWLEVITENYLVPGGKPLYYLERIRERFPLVMHGVSLSIGSTDPLDLEYLHTVRALARAHRAALDFRSSVLDGSRGTQYARSAAAALHRRGAGSVVARVGAGAGRCSGRQILLENVSSYLTYHASEMTEWEFLSEVARRADCAILLDINNIYVSSVNHGFDAWHYLRAIPKERVRQFHLAGHSDMGGHLIDTHDHPIAAAGVGSVSRGRRALRRGADHDRARRQHSRL